MAGSDIERAAAYVELVHEAKLATIKDRKNLPLVQRARIILAHGNGVIHLRKAKGLLELRSHPLFEVSRGS